MRRFGLIGYPLTHSFSKKYFTEKFEKEGIADCAYELYAIPSINELPQILAEYKNLEGINVTIPYKKEVLSFLNGASNAVNEMQACNCIAIKQGELIGYNTDVMGFEKTFVPHLKSNHTKALILGTGGASAAVAYTLKKLGIEFLFVSRNNINAEKGIITYPEITKQVLSKFSVIINTTPVGTFPNLESFPDIPYHFITNQHYLYDLVYNPPQTVFLNKGAAQGAITENGAEMLVIQAEESWKIWNDL